MEGTLGGRFTTVEGLIVAIKEQVRLVCYSMEGTLGGRFTTVEGLIVAIKEQVRLLC